MKEIWRDIKKYPGYQISNLGRVKSFRGKSPLVMKLCLNTWGYLQVKLQNGVNKWGKSIPVHTLVLTTFCGPMPAGKNAAHLDGVRTNAKLSNLKWLTVKENHSHKARHGTLVRGEKHAFSKLTNRKVLVIRKLFASGEYSGLELAARFKVSKSQISSVVCRRTWKHI